MSKQTRRTKALKALFPVTYNLPRLPEGVVAFQRRIRLDAEGKLITAGELYRSDRLRYMPAALRRLCVNVGTVGHCDHFGR
jgi:hypothetical protein